MVLEKKMKQIFAVIIVTLIGSSFVGDVLAFPVVRSWDNKVHKGRIARELQPPPLGKAELHDIDVGPPERIARAVRPLAGKAELHATDEGPARERTARAAPPLGVKEELHAIDEGPTRERIARAQPPGGTARLYAIRSPQRGQWK